MGNLILPAILGISLLAVLAPALQSQAVNAASIDRARSVLKEGAAERDPESRREVAVALSLISTRDSSASLLERLAQDKEHLTREAALISIGERGDRRRLKLGESAFSDEVPEVLFAAARPQMKMKHREGRRILIAILEKETPAESSFFRGRLRDLARRVKTPKSALLFGVQQGAGLVPVPGFGEGLSALTSMLGDADFSARATSLFLLAPENSTEIRKHIEEAFQDEDWSVRAAAVQVAASRHETRWRSRLIPLIDDTNRKVRYRAAAVLVRLNYPAGRNVRRSR
jgi:HEAT repeat protein